MEGLFGNYTTPPEIRLDPFQSFFENGTVIAGFSAAIASPRGNRPREISPVRKRGNEEEKKVTADNLLLDIANGKEPAIVVSTDDHLVQNPLDPTVVPKKIKVNAKAISIVNKYPIFSRNRKNLPYGFMLVTFPTTQMYYPRENPTAIGFMMKSIKNAIELRNNDASLARSKAISFFNIGPNSGASLKQLHAQTYIWRGDREIVGRDSYLFKKAYNSMNHCLGCLLSQPTGIEKDHLNQSLHLKKRIIYDGRFFKVFFAYAPLRMLHVRIIPKRHIATISQFEDEELVELGNCIALADDAIFYVSSSLGYPFQDRSIALREDYEEQQMHMLIDVLPSWPLGGAELVTSLTIVSRSPEEASKIFSDNKQ